jgi:hypothetical protein
MRQADVGFGKAQLDGRLSGREPGERVAPAATANEPSRPSGACRAQDFGLCRAYTADDESQEAI